MSIRWRVTIWFSLVLLVILLFSDFLLSTLLKNYLYNNIDNNLELYSARVHGTLNPDVMSGSLDFNVIHDKLPPVNEFSSPGLYIQIMDPDGKVVVKSNNLGNQELPINPILIENGLRGRADIQTVAAGDGAKVRIMVSPMYFQEKTLLLEIAQSLQPVEAALGQMRFALLIENLIAMVLTVSLGVIMVRRTLEPVENITRIASNIGESSDLRRRVNYNGPHDEVGHLANTFDRMIERLEKTFEAQKRFIADASHEFRTPLTIIQGNLDLLKRNISEEDRKESLRAIESESKRLNKIADDLLLLAEVEAGQIKRTENVSLQDLITQEIKRARLIAGKRIITTGRLEPIYVKGDAHRLSQVLENLVDNAIKYTQDEGIITLSVFRNRDWACIEVSDNGIGIASENLPYLFDRFYREDKARSRSKGGTGLGLAIVKEIVEQHGGKITVASEPGKGSVFTIWLKL